MENTATGILAKNHALARVVRIPPELRGLVRAQDAREVEVRGATPRVLARVVRLGGLLEGPVLEREKLYVQEGSQMYDQVSNLCDNNNIKKKELVSSCGSLLNG